jgi:hypothetical protein
MLNFYYIDEPMTEVTKSSIKQDHFSKKLLKCDVFTNAIILPACNNLKDKLGGGIVSENGDYIERTSLHKGGGRKYEYSGIEIEEDCTCFYLGYMYNVWGHCITDCLKNLWYFLTPEGQALLKHGIKIVYIAPANFKFSRSTKDLLECLGIKTDNLYYVNRITKCKRIIVPEDSFTTENEIRYFTKEYIDTINTIIKNIHIKPSTIDKLYFTRSHLHKNNGYRDFGEKNIENIFRKLGFKIVAPEKLSFFEQVSMLQGCSTFAATEGSISHNALFLREGANLILLRKAPYLTGYQLAINEMKKLNVTYIDAHLSAFVDKDSPWEGPFFMYVNSNLIRFANEKGLELHHVKFPYRLFIKYVIASLKNNFKPNDYYQNIVSKFMQAKEIWKNVRYKYYLCIIMKHISLLENFKYSRQYIHKKIDYYEEILNSMHIS